MRRIVFAFAGFVALTLHVGVADAQLQWQEFRSDSAGFVVSLPHTPEISTERVGTSNMMQKNFQISGGGFTYSISVFQLTPGKVRKNQDEAYFQRLLKGYAQGSDMVLRSSKAATIAGHPGVEAIAEDDNSTHQLQTMAVGDRVYLLICAGPKGKENAAGPVRFWNSFKLID